MGSDYLGNLECSKQILFWTYTNPSQVYSWWRNWFSTGVSKAGGCSITWLKALIEYWFVLLLLLCMVTICISLHTLLVCVSLHNLLVCISLHTSVFSFLFTLYSVFLFPLYLDFRAVLYVFVIILTFFKN